MKPLAITRVLKYQLKGTEMKSFLSASIIVVLLAFGAAAWAAGAGRGDHDSNQAANAQQPVQIAQADPAIAEGEVRKIDKENKKITIRHGEIKNLEMPGMTMVFQVKEPAMLDSLKSGDKVRFSAEKLDGGLVVTRIEPAK